MVYPVSVSLVIICIVHNKCTIRSLASIYVLVSCIDYIWSPAMAWYYVSRTRHLGRNCNSQFSGRDWSLPYAMPTWRIAYHPPILRSVSRPVLPASIFLVFNSNSEGLSVCGFIRRYNDWLFFFLFIFDRERHSWLKKQNRSHWRNSSSLCISMLDTKIWKQREVGCKLGLLLLTMKFCGKIGSDHISE